MTSSCLEPEQHWQPNRVLLLALGLSLAAHLLVLGLALRPAGPPALSVPDKDVLQLRLAAPARPAGPDTATVPGGPADQAEPATAPAVEPGLSSLPLEPVQDMAPSISGSNNSSIAPIPDPPGLSEPVLDGLSIQGAIAAYAREHAAGLNESWSSQCLQRKRQGAGQDCNPGGAGREARYAAPVAALVESLEYEQWEQRQRLQLQQAMPALQNLETGGGLLGMLATERRRLAGETLNYLGSNLNESARRYAMQVLGDNPNAAFVAGSMLQFTCKPSPCDYRLGRPVARERPEPAGQLPGFALQPAGPWRLDTQPRSK